MAFERVVENFCRRMETLTLLFRPVFSLLFATPPAAPPPKQRSTTPIDLKWHEIKLASEGVGISFASRVRVSANAPRARSNYDWISSIVCSDRDDEGEGREPRDSEWIVLHSRILAICSVFDTAWQSTAA